MTITTHQARSLPRPRSRGLREMLPVDSTTRLVKPSVAPPATAGLTLDERAELLCLRAEKAQLQTRVYDLNLELTLVKAAAALFVGERGRPGHGAITAPEVV
jgi:hypothetical protein